MTDKILVSRKEIEALLDGIIGWYEDDLRVLLDKAEVSEPCVVDRFSSRCCEKGTKSCNVKHAQPSRIAELESEVARLNAIIEDIKVIDNVFGVDDKDGERYRTIRKSGNNMRVVFGKYPDGINIHASENHLCGTALDEQIDLAMKAK